MREILDVDATRKLDVVRRPARLQEVLRQLEQHCDRNPGKISADKQILADAIGECRQVLRAAETAEPPPRDLRLAQATDAELEAWASEGSGSRRVTPGTPVFTALIHHLAQRRDLIRQAFDLWPRTDQDAPELPRGWRKVLTDTCGEGADIACALVEDALPEPGERPLLEPAPRQEPPANSDRTFWFVLARETGELPPWAEPLGRRLDDLQARIDAVADTYDGEAAEALQVARDTLAAIEPDEAEDWLKQAAEMHRDATQGADLDKIRDRARARADHLAALGHEAPTQDDDVQAWAVAVEERWRGVRDDLRAQVDALAARAASLRGDVEPVRAAVESARRDLSRAELPAAATALDAARSALSPLLEAEAARLGPELWSIAQRAVPAGVTAAIERAVARRAAGLDSAALVRDLVVLVDQLDDAALVTLDGERVAWVLGGVATAGATSARGVRVGPVTVTVGPPGDATERVARWGEVQSRANPGALGRVYLRALGAVEGPYRAAGDDLVPEDPSVAVASLSLSEFDRLFGRLEIGDDRWLVPHPPSLEELLQVGAQAVDRLDDEAAARWLATELDGAPPPDALRRWLGAHEALSDGLREARLARLTDLVARAEALEPARAEAIDAWLASDEGRAAVDRAADALVDRESEELQRRLDARVAELKAAEQELDEARDRVGAEIARLQEEVTAVEELLNDRKLELMAKFACAGSVVAAPTAPQIAEAPSTPIRASRFSPSHVPDLPRLVQLVAGPTWGEVEVANLLLSIATGRWTLLAGLPGVGKSTFVRSVLTRLGHGPGTERYLELVVRRDWQDDAALFGFWHPTQGRWTPSSEGFVEHLLRAADGAGAGAGALWPVLVEELNLASPEYYLARMLSAFEAAQPTVRLYDEELAPTNATRYPPAFEIPASVRVFATVNVDDTVERLSPRFLSRASVIWVEPDVDAPLWRAEDDVTDLAVPFSALVAEGEADLGPITELVRFLRDQRVPGAPTARTRRAMGRYLAAARGVLPADVAQDLQVLQRVLPPLRGVGPRWRKLLDRMGELLQRHGWERSAARTLELRERGEELGDWYDFFHT
ncbi:MAG: AAA family ATPase [Alphaproteobacteria bacterium]|nr:AAA family ATPase [Alphaproteobacteria bacterium]